MRVASRLPVLILAAFLLVCNGCGGGKSGVPDVVVEEHVASVCTPGERRCHFEPGRRESCSEDGLSWSQPEDCPVGSTCESGKCLCPSCAIVADGKCTPVGVSQCGTGFELDDECGCRAVLDECPQWRIPLLGGGVLPWARNAGPTGLARRTGPAVPLLIGVRPIPFPGSAAVVP